MLCFHFFSFDVFSDSPNNEKKRSLTSVVSTKKGERKEGSSNKYVSYRLIVENYELYLGRSVVFTKKWVD